MLHHHENKSGYGIIRLSYPYWLQHHHLIYYRLTLKFDMPPEMEKSRGQGTLFSDLILERIEGESYI
jgi:hypothetical protein